MNSQPATPIEKLKCLELQARERGKRFHENEMIDYVNRWWLERGGDPVYCLRHVAEPLILEESPERARETRMSDSDALRELEEAKRAAQAAIAQAKSNDIADSLARARLARLEEQLAELLEENRRLREERGLPAREEPEELGERTKPPADLGKTATVQPSMAWSLKQLQTYARTIGIDYNFDGWTKAELLQEIIKREQEAAGVS